MTQHGMMQLMKLQNHLMTERFSIFCIQERQGHARTYKDTQADKMSDELSAFIESFGRMYGKINNNCLIIWGIDYGNVIYILLHYQYTIVKYL